MANVATMGPPPSPKEPRRSGRRQAPSSSKSPAGSPPSEVNPKTKDNATRPPPNSSHTNGRNKRAKNEDLDEPLEELHKNGVTSNGGQPRYKRKGREKEKIALVVEIPNDGNDNNPEAVGDDAAGENGDDEEESGVTRCICQKYGSSRRVDRPQRVPKRPIGEEDNEQGEFMVQCDMCKAWQHGSCMHYDASDNVPLQYFCEECRPDLWVDVVRCALSFLQSSSSGPYHAPQRLGSKTCPASLIAFTSAPYPDRS